MVLITSRAANGQANLRMRTDSPDPFATRLQRMEVEDRSEQTKVL